MGEIIAFLNDSRTAPKARGQSFEQRLSDLKRKRVPAEHREAVARALGQLAGKVGPTPKKGAGRIIEAAGRSDLASKRKRSILLDGEQPHRTKFRASWADYIVLGEAAIGLLGLRGPESEKERERLMRRIIDARPAGVAPDLTYDTFDIRSLVTDYIARIVNRIRAEVPELEELQRLAVSNVSLAHIRSCSVELPLGALEWDIAIDAFLFPPALIEKCPRLLIGGDLSWDDPESNKEAANFDAWLSQFDSPIGLPEQAFDPDLGYGWKPIRIKVYEPVSLLISPPLSLASADAGKISYVSDWDASISLEGCQLYNTPVIEYSRQRANEKYIKDMIQGIEIDCYRGDDFCLRCPDFWYTGFDVLHCMDPEGRSSTDVDLAKRRPPFLLDARDEELKRVDEPESISFLSNDQLEGRALKALQIGNYSNTPRFLPNFEVDEDHPVPAGEGTFVASLLRNMKHAPDGERLSDIAVATARSVALETKMELQKVAALVAAYREGLE